MELLKVASLFAITAVAEIVGCYLPWLVIKQGRATWLLIPAALSLALFAWLLTLHPMAAGRTYAAYGGAVAPLRRWHPADPMGFGRRNNRAGRHGGHCTATSDERVTPRNSPRLVASATELANHNRPPPNPPQQRK